MKWANWTQGHGLRATGRLAKSTISDIVKQEASQKVYALMVDRAEALSENIARLERGGHLGFFGVTGNLFSSMGVSVIKNDPKTHRYILSRTFMPYQRGAGEPTRKPLRAGERYLLPYYYSGKENKAPFKATMDGGLRTGIERAIQYRQDLRGGKSTGKRHWVSLYVYANMPYAKAINEKRDNKLQETLTGLLKAQFGR